MKPGPVFFIVSLLWLLLAAAAYFIPFLVIFWIYTGIALVPLLALDFLVLYFLCDRLEVKREISPVLSQGKSIKVKLIFNRHYEKSAGKSIHGFSFLPSKISIFDLHPLSMETAAFPAVINKKLFSKTYLTNYARR